MLLGSRAASRIMVLKVNQRACNFPKESIVLKKPEMSFSEL